MIDWTTIAISAIVSAAVAVPAYAFAALTWQESRKQRLLLETITKTIPFVSRPRRRSASRRATTPSPTALAVRPNKLELQQRAEERKRLKLQLEQEKEQWRRQKDVAKAIGWLVDRLDSSDDDEED